MLRFVLRNTWGIYRRNIAAIATVVAIVWLPCDLFSAYLDAFYYGTEELSRSVKLYRLLDNFIGIIATAGVVHIALQDARGAQCGLGGGLRTGLTNWGRMWWTRLLRGLCVVLGVLLLVVTAIIFGVRFALIEVVIVAEGLSGREALRRSWELTRGQFWKVFGVSLALMALLVVPVVAIVLPTALVEEWDVWWANGLIGVAHNIMIAFFFVGLFSIYQFLISQETLPPAVVENL